MRGTKWRLGRRPDAGSAFRSGEEMIHDRLLGLAERQPHLLLDVDARSSTCSHAASPGDAAWEPACERSAGRHRLGEASPDKVPDANRGWSSGARFPKSSQLSSGGVPMMTLRPFDAAALYQALDAHRAELGVSWKRVADQMWDLSCELNDRRADHPVSPSTPAAMANTPRATCQHALFMLRWLDRTPESFVHGAVDGNDPHFALPVANPDRRLRWSLKLTWAAMDEKRRQQDLTWGSWPISSAAAPTGGPGCAPPGTPPTWTWPCVSSSASSDPLATSCSRVTTTAQSRCDLPPAAVVHP